MRSPPANHTNVIEVTNMRWSLFWLAGFGLRTLESCELEGLWVCGALWVSDVMSMHQNDFTVTLQQTGCTYALWHHFCQHETYARLTNTMISPQLGQQSWKGG